ncbi:phage tail protein [Paenibacillus sp. FSL R5-808]|jgi:hypothetical protein|uniref:phage tail-collar fiber domain-containing protein n=1 Tax=unclassified Paenibacillus TaxID=185978 RepID=UPI0003E29DDB|nr:phage tail protein [Paenibacillus sp. FSL R5-808]ETT32122.1 hypothetical protein C169_23970 [Paenibacillus sp. FSL R5-808]
MGAFGGFIQTNKGRNLQAKAETGTQLKFTRMGVGDGQLSGQSIPSLNRLISEKKSLPITRLKTQLPAQAIVGAVLSNQDVTTGFYFREMGIFAEDPDEGEILYAYGNSGSGAAEYISAGGTADIIEKTIDMIVTFGQAQNVSAVIDSSLVYVTHEELAEALDGLGTPSGTASGTVVNGNTVYTATLSPAITTLKAFQRVVVKTNVASTGAPTFNFNGLGAKTALKANGSPASFKANGVYTLVYDGTAFILQGEGGEVGTATAGDVLAGKTFPGEDGLITGTMPNLTGIRTATGVSKWPDNALAVYPEKGYQKGGAGDGEIKVTTAQLQAAEAALRSENIKNGANIYGVPGKSTVVDTADAVLDPQYLLVGQSGYDDGVKKTGQMRNLSAENNHMPGLEKTVWPGDRYFIRPPRGFIDGNTWVTAAEPQLIASNIRNGANIGGIIGNLIEGRPTIQGTISAPYTNDPITIPVSFQPICIVLTQGTGSGATGHGQVLGMIRQAGASGSGPVLRYMFSSSDIDWTACSYSQANGTIRLSYFGTWQYGGTWNYIIYAR